MMIQFLLVGGLTLLSALATLTYPWVWYLWLITFLGIAEFALSFRFIRENERVVPVLLGRIRKELGATLTPEERAITENPAATPAQRAPLPDSGLLGTGVVFLLFPLYQLKRYPITVQQLPREVGRVTTTPGTQDLGNGVRRQLGAAELTLGVVMNFQWNVSNLRPAVANAPPPLDERGEVHPQFRKLVEPEIDDATRRAAAPKTWYEIYYDRGGMEQRIEEILSAPDSTLARAGIRDSASIKISLPQVDLPDALRDTINEEQAALFKAEATKRAAEAERYKREQEGTGLAEARKKLFEAIRGASRVEGDQNRLAEALVTLREMAQGQASTIFVPEAVTLTLGQAFGESRPQQVLQMLFAGLTGEQKENLLKEALREIGKREK